MILAADRGVYEEGSADEFEEENMFFFNAFFVLGRVFLFHIKLNFK